MIFSPRRWPRCLWGLRRRRRPIVRLWDAELNYVSTLTDGGRESWGEYLRRLLRAATRPASPHREVLECASGASITIDM